MIKVRDGLSVVGVDWRQGKQIRGGLESPHQELRERAGGGLGHHSVRIVYIVYAFLFPSSSARTCLDHFSFRFY